MKGASLLTVKQPSGAAVAQLTLAIGFSSICDALRLQTGSFHALFGVMRSTSLNSWTWFAETRHSFRPTT